MTSALFWSRLQLTTIVIIIEILQEKDLPRVLPAVKKWSCFRVTFLAGGSALSDQVYFLLPNKNISWGFNVILFTEFLPQVMILSYAW